MGYPDLMFRGGAGTRRTELSVFEDIKLTALLRESTISSMCIPCGAEDITARQELFRALSDRNFYSHIEKLSVCMDTIYGLAQRYDDARCDNEKYILYLNLCAGIAEFFGIAADEVNPERGGELYERFCSYFSGRAAHPNFKRLAEDLSKVRPLIKSAVCSQYKIIGDELRISAETPEAYMTKLLRDADTLGLSGVSAPKMEAKTLTPAIIDATAALYPSVFAEIAGFYERNKNFYEEEILMYKSQLDFYLDVCAMLKRISEAGVPICYPKPCDEKKIDISNAYDITLLTKGEKNIIPNDIYFDSKEPFFYLTGANGGGKTTFLRTIGVTVLLFLNGCPAPCDHADIYPMHNMFTHFPRDERFDNAGRNAEEQQRVQRILDATDGCSLILLNETYSTTSEEKARMQTSTLAEKLYADGEFGVYVTHMHNMGETNIPFLNVIIDRSDSNRRTYKVARQKSVYSSYAYDILQKYSLTKEQLDRRFASAVNSSDITEDSEK